jgi:UDP-GlcNAc:undecaprenyl-phosphate/decaprenyl-phosphate GlcNAc-1-phosphate transferase
MTFERLAVANHRGVIVPRTLGIWLAAAAAVSSGAVAALGGPGSVSRGGWGALVATLLVFAAGVVDDIVPDGPRGIRAHLGSLVSGHVSTGIIKVLVIVASAVVAVALQPDRPGWIRVAGVVLVAASANVWNGLDVRPGRAIKFGMLSMLGLVNVDLALLPTLPGVAVASVVALWPDLRERAMLGDGGANLLGFTIGLGLYVALPDPGAVVAAAIAVVINAVAETVTLSRVIAAVPPLRWFDELGRLPA